MEAKLAFLGHALMENRAGLIVNACLTPADGHGERNAALANRPTAVTLGADKGYDADSLIGSLTARAIKSVIPSKENRKIKRDCDFALYRECNLIERGLYQRLSGSTHMCPIAHAD